MSTEYLRHPRLRGDTNLNTAVSPPNVDTPATVQPTDTRFISFGENATSATFNRAIGSVQENVDWVHAQMFAEVANPQSFNVANKALGAAFTLGTGLNVPGNVLRVLVNAGGVTTDDYANIFSVLNEDFEEIQKADGTVCQVTSVTQETGGGALELGAGLQRGLHTPHQPSAVSRFSITCAGASFQAPMADPPVSDLRPACPGDLVEITNFVDEAGPPAVLASQNNGTVGGGNHWIIHKVISDTELELRNAADPSKQLLKPAAIPGIARVTVVSNKDFYVNPLLTLNYDPTLAEPNGTGATAVWIFCGTSRQPISSWVQNGATATYPLSVDSLIKVKIRAAEEDVRTPNVIEMVNKTVPNVALTAGQVVIADSLTHNGVVLAAANAQADAAAAKLVGVVVGGPYAHNTTCTVAFNGKAIVNVKLWANLGGANQPVRPGQLLTLSQLTQGSVENAAPAAPASAIIGMVLDSNAFDVAGVVQGTAIVLVGR